MNIDLLRGVTSHLTASIVIVGGTASIVLMTFQKVIPPDAGLPAIAAIVAGAAGFMWGSETAKQAAKQTKNDLMTDTSERIV